MKVAMTLDVSEGARLHIGALNKGDLDARALANREVIREYMQRYVTALGEKASALHLGALTDEEIKDAREAVTYLRAKGMQDHEIRNWLLIQQARISVATRRLESTRKFEQAEIA